MSPRKRKTYHEIDPEEAITALSTLKNDPHFKKYIEMREAMREGSNTPTSNKSNHRLHKSTLHDDR